MDFNQSHRAGPRNDEAPSVLSWRITTRRALTQPVVPGFLNVLRRRLRTYRFDEEAVATALHEAVTNAAVHGNLGFAATAASGLEAADELSRKVEACLADAGQAGRPIVITAARKENRLVVSVRDSGAGFVPDEAVQAHAGMPHGRGIQLMRSLALSVQYQHGGRQVCLTFKLQQLEIGGGTAAKDDPAELLLRASRILVVDDSELQRDMIAHWLGEAGFTNITFAIDGNEAMRLYYEVEPDLILLDLAMPGMDGIEVCQTLATRHPGSVPIIVHSAIGQPDARVHAFAAGAVDFIVKPIHPPELIARVRTQLDNRWMLHSLHEFRARLNDELNVARLMQETLMPSAESLASVRASMGLDIAARNEMSSELGGDIWGLREIDETRLGVFIADFTGHGVASAMNAFRLHAVLGESGIRFERPELVMQALNVRLAGVLPLGSFATLFYGVLDTARDVLEYTAAGAPAPVLLLPDGSLQEIDTSGVPVGVRPWQDYDVRSVPFPPGASIFLYSDALIETADQDGHSWDAERLQTVLRAGAALDANGQLERVVEAFDAGRRRPLPDDLTLIFLRRVIEVAAHAAP